MYIYIGEPRQAVHTVHAGEAWRAAEGRRQRARPVGGQELHRGSRRLYRHALGWGGQRRVDLLRGHPCHQQRWIGGIVVWCFLFK